jgi:hypothetical protein
MTKEEALYLTMGIQAYKRHQLESLFILPHYAQILIHGLIELNIINPEGYNMYNKSTEFLNENIRRLYTKEELYAILIHLKDNGYFKPRTTNPQLMAIAKKVFNVNPGKEVMRKARGKAPLLIQRLGF